MRYEREYAVCHVGEIGIVLVCSLFLMSPVRDIRKPKCTAYLHRVGVSIIKIGINMPPVLRSFRRWIHIEHCGSQYACCVITLSWCRFSYAFRGQVFIIIAGHIILIKRRLTKSRSLGRSEMIAARNIFGIHDGVVSMFVTLFVLHINQKPLCALGGIRVIVLRMNIHDLVPILKGSQIPKRINHMCGNETHSGCWHYIA